MTYSLNNRKEAIELVKNGATLQEASKKTGIPLSTIGRWMIEPPKKEKPKKVETTRLNVDLPKVFFNKVKSKAALNDDTIQSVVTLLLTEYLNEK